VEIADLVVWKHRIAVVETQEFVYFRHPLQHVELVPAEKITQGHWFKM